MSRAVLGGLQRVAPPVLGVAAAPDVAGVLQGVHDADEVAGVHPQPLGDLALRQRPVPRRAPQDEQVRQPRLAGEHPRRGAPDEPHRLEHEVGRRVVQRIGAVLHVRLLGLRWRF
ncbi:hypothetical protein LUX57_03220 [Actinomadura madurae]|nr:hypothetical protein [Actinomadura madurae]MCP9964307.1 hypothetical protein [Actinomadura madurae]